MLSLVSVIFGLFLGFMISVILIEVVNPQTFFWTIDMRIPFKHIIFMSSITVLSILISVIICFSFFEKKSSD
jgi:putative ABC transport system permease protein